MINQVEKMKSWCMDNYNNGASTMVECWSNSEFEGLFQADEFNKETPTVEQAWQVLKDIAAIYRDREADASNSEF